MLDSLSRLQAENAALQAAVFALNKEKVALTTENAQLKRRISELEAQAGGINGHPPSK